MVKQQREATVEAITGKCLISFVLFLVRHTVCHSGMNTHKHNQTWLPQKHVFVCLLQVNEHHSVKCDCVLTVSLVAFNCLQSHLLRFNHNVSEISQHSPLHNVLAICAIQYDAQTDDMSLSCNTIKPFVSEGFVKSSAKRFIGNNQIMSR